MLCPTCREPLDPESHSCVAGHRHNTVGGVLRLLSTDLAPRLEAFLEAFRPLRESDGRRIHDPSVFPRLPFAAEVTGDPEWRTRGYDLAVIQRLIAGRSPGTALDIGAYNGWLSHRLAVAGYRVTAVDYFVDELDGLRAHRFFPTSWRAIQVDLRDLSVLEERFDLVVLNRCIQFFDDPPAMVARTVERVADGGILVLTGLEIFADPSTRQRGVETLVARLARHGMEPFIPIKGYLDRRDQERLLALGVDLRLYPQPRMLLALLRSRFDRRRGRPCYGVWTT